MDDFDLPPEPPMVDLHLGAATVKTFNKNWWMETYGPKPPGPGIITMNVLVVLLAMANLVLFFNVWKWMLV